MTAVIFAILVALSPAPQQPAEWTQPQKPVRIFANTYYVGTRGLSAILITSPTGAVLIDGAMRSRLPTSPTTSRRSASSSRTSS